MEKSVDYGFLMREFLVSRGVNGDVLAKSEGFTKNFSCVMPQNHKHGDKNPSANAELSRGIYKCFVCYPGHGDGVGLKDLMRDCGCSDADWRELIQQSQNGSHNHTHNYNPNPNPNGESPDGKRIVDWKRSKEYLWEDVTMGESFRQQRLEYADGGKREYQWRKPTPTKRGAKFSDFVYLKTLTRKAGTLVVCEGAGCADVAHEAGFDSLAIWKAGTVPSASVFDRVFGGSSYGEVVLWPDYDKPKDGESLGVGDKAMRWVGREMLKCCNGTPMSIVDNTALWAGVNPCGQDIVDVPTKDKRVAVINGAVPFVVSDDEYDADQSEDGGENYKWIDAMALWDKEELGDEINYVVENFVAPGDRTDVSGDPGSGKSFLGLDMILAIRMGQNFLGMKTRPVRCYYVDQEMSAAAMRIRFRKLAWGRGFDEKTMREMFEGQFVFSDYESLPISLLNPQGGDDALVNHFAGFELIIFDSWARVIEGAMNDGEAVTRANLLLKRIARETGASIVIISHTNKNPEARGQHKVSGSVQITAAADFLFLTTMTKGGGKIGYRVVNEKNKHGELMGDLEFAIRQTQEGHLMLTHGEKKTREEIEKEKYDGRVEQVYKFVAENNRVILKDIRESKEIKIRFNLLKKILEQLVAEKRIQTEGERPKYYFAKVF